MRCLIATLIWIILLSLPVQAGEFIALCYHDVADRVIDTGGNAISTDRLVQHFSWLRANGFKVIGINDLLAAQRGERPLPARAVLLTFDDGYASFYTRVYPLLKAFGYPAVLGIVGGWLEVDRDGAVAYGNGSVPRHTFMTWEQLREVAASGLVEVASHSYDLHHEVIANPQLNMEPALASREYDPETGRYEDDATHLARLRDDLRRNSDLLERRLGHRPRVMVWPFGRYHLPAQALARELGMPVALTLESGTSRTGLLGRVRRLLVPGDCKLDDLAWELYNPDKLDPRRVATIDLDDVYDRDPVEQERKLDRVLDRIKGLRINTVFLRAFSDQDHNGSAEAVYFPNRHLPVRADLFNRVSWQLKTRAGVNVFASMPTLGFDLGNRNVSVQSVAGEPSPLHPPDPSAAEARRVIAEIYEDLARHGDFEGLLLNDEGPTGSGAAPAWTGELADRARIWRPTIKTACTLPARSALNSDTETANAPSLQTSLDRHDFAVIQAGSGLEQAVAAESWLVKMVSTVKAIPGGMQKTIFQLGTLDREGDSRIPPVALGRQMQLLQRLGAVNFGYYPDGFPWNEPDRQHLYRAVSLQTNPYRHDHD